MARPPQELKAFAKVWLDPGESETVALTLDDRAFALLGRRPRTPGPSSPASSSSASARRRATSGAASDHDRLSATSARHSPSDSPNYGATFARGEWHRFVDLGRAADDAGVDRVVVVDHVVMGPHTENYAWGKFPVPPDAPWFEPLTMLTAIAAVTTRVRLATGILIAPLRPAAFLAKQVATLDQLSRGRVDLGVGTGWQREEYDAEGLDFDRAASCSPTRSPRARRCGATRPPSSTRRRSRSATSTASRSRSSRAACRCGSRAR